MAESLMNIWWIRRDLRLEDNQALTAALDEGSGLLPVFILDDNLLANSGDRKNGFLFAGLRALEAELQRRGSGLIVRSGDPVEQLALLAAEAKAEKIFAEADVTPYSRKRDAAAARNLNLRLVYGLSVHPAAVVVQQGGKPYTVFTPFSRAWKALPFGGRILPAPSRLPPLPDLPSVELPSLPVPEDFPAGEAEANRRLEAFISGPIMDYGNGRDRLDLDGTSALSPYFHFGMISANKAAAAAHLAAQAAPDDRAKHGCESWLNELIWREFYQAILYHFPEVLKTSFRPSMRNIPWRNAPDELRAWQNGLTGYPIVDAGMRQLAATGWMHNRARMIAASFLVKHLLINWQEGERWFMRRLIDGDLAANNGGWQWTAGTGTDAAPYFRIFNPILQGKKFDPEGVYVRRWVPELAGLPAKYIHSPWEMPAEEQQKVRVILGRDYPLPVVEHGFARQRVLEAYSKS